MRLVIADPPYPPHRTIRYDRAVPRVITRSRARRYYGDGTRWSGETPADFHPDAAEWDEPARHRQLLEELEAGADCWAIATTPDGLAAYGVLPPAARLLAWVKPNNPPSGNRVRGLFELVIAYTHPTRRLMEAGRGTTDVLIKASPRIGFAGAKPAAWTHWVLDVLGYLPGDEVIDMFPGSGSVAAAIESWPDRLEGL